MRDCILNIPVKSKDLEGMNKDWLAVVTKLAISQIPKPPKKKKSSVRRRTQTLLYKISVKNSGLFRHFRDFYQKGKIMQFSFSIFSNRKTFHFDLGTNVPYRRVVIR